MEIPKVTFPLSDGVRFMNEDRTLGEYPIISELLEEIYREKMEFFRNYARKYGVPEEDLQVVINDTYLILQKMKAMGKIKELTKIAEARELTPEERARLKKALTALFVYYLRLQCLTYLRGQQPPTVNMDFYWLHDEEFIANLRLYLLSLCPIIVVDIDKFIAGDLQTIHEFYSKLAKTAGLTDQEFKLLWYLFNNPEEREQDFDPILLPYKIARLKKAAFQKIIEFLSSIEKREVRFTRQEYQAFLKKYPHAESVLEKHIIKRKKEYYLDLDKLSAHDNEELEKEVVEALINKFQTQTLQN
jgi:hypothetical protein